MQGTRLANQQSDISSQNQALIKNRKIPCAHSPRVPHFWHRNLGNAQSTAFVQRKICAASCAGTCTKSSQEQALNHLPHAKLTVGPVNDHYERQADHMADRIMRMPDRSDAESLTGARNEAAFQHLSTVGHAGPISPYGRIGISRTGGRPLSSASRLFMEPRFGVHFGHVRQHDDSVAHRVASQINARAFTYGHHIWFGKGEGERDRRLMAHELTHVVQQGDSAGSNDVQAGSRGARVQRTVRVNPSVAAANDIMSQFHFLCPSVNFSLHGRSIVGNQSSVVSKSCECVSDVVGDPSRTYTIQVDNVTNTPRTVTLHNGTSVSVPYPSSGPRTFNGTNPLIYMPSSTNSAFEFGAFTPSGGADWAPNWRILGHELCGHGRLNQSYTGTKGNRPGHDATIGTENTIAAEHGSGPRGVFANPRQGESYHNLVGNRSQIVYKLRAGWHYQAP
jgi:hypothetical protein